MQDNLSYAIDTASLYEPFGFQRIDEYDFELEGTPPRQAFSPIKKIDLANPADLERLQDMLARRLPLSEQFGIVQEQVIFILDTLTWPIYYSETHRALIAYTIEAETLYVRDIVFTKPVNLEAILACISEPYSKVVLQFCLDRFPHLKYNPIKTTPEDFLNPSQIYPFLQIKMRLR